MAAVAVFMPTAMLLGARGTGDVIVLTTAVIVALIAGVPLARHLWRTPAQTFPTPPRVEGNDAAD